MASSFLGLGHTRLFASHAQGTPTMPTLEKICMLLQKCYQKYDMLMEARDIKASKHIPNVQGFNNINVSSTHFPSYLDCTYVRIFMGCRTQKSGPFGPNPIFNQLCNKK